MSIPKRPTWPDDYVVRKAAELLAPKLKAWLVECDKHDDTPLDDIVNDLAKAMDWHTDGYELAKNLEREGWMPDAQMVEVLESAAFAKHDAVAFMCKEWVKAYGVQPPPLEAMVKDPKHPERGVGLITENHSDGRSTVMFPKLGHVREGAGNHGLILNWEDLNGSSVPAVASPA